MSSVLPASVPLSLWEEFRKMRKKKRAPLTEYAETLILCKLEKWRIEMGANPVDVLNESIEKGWSGVFLNGHGKALTTETVHMLTQDLCCICKRPLNGSFIYCSSGRRCHEC